MANNDDLTYRKLKVNTTSGHFVYYWFSVQSLNARTEWPYLLLFSTDCAIYRTSWTLGIDYQQVQETNRFTCSVFLRRDYPETRVLDIRVKVALLNTNGDVIRFSQTFLHYRSRPGDVREVMGSVTDALPAPMRLSGSQNVNLKVTIRIRNCHQTNVQGVAERVESEDDQANN